MEIFVTSDLHLGHRKAAESFKRDDGTPLRPFGTIDATNEAIITRINERVGEGDILYILGDIAWNSSGFGLLKEIKCRDIRAVLGNHDRNTIEEYRSVFSEVHGAVARDNVLMTHVPIHPSCLGRRFQLNAHGHLHSYCVTDGEIPDPKYLCVSVERFDFYPVHWDYVLARKSAYAVGADN